ncbi:hypothetical protein EZV62_027749 [Acer yangbiense]|uniref:Uncharacterized protein n=1 Tax=Acer yangbiense TaxID=1000413 RepID=A0A5C7GVC6_9ROSI|nr:hypothetical protein EZV62_027749 [Acer yangbiense]
MAVETGLAVLSGIVSKVAELFIDSIKQKMCYAFEYEKNMEQLKKKVDDLTVARERVERSVEVAKNRGEEIHKDVEKWLIRVNEFTETVAKPIIDDEDKAKKRCFKGLCPNLLFRYSFSKKAANAVKDGVNLHGETADRFAIVSYRPVPQRTKSFYIRDYQDFDSRMPIFQDIMVALKDAEVSQTSDIKEIQGQIADQLGLEFHEESLAGRASRLRDRLKKEKRVLVILDNIWVHHDLGAIGISFGDDEKGTFTQQGMQNVVNQRQCKVLATSRNLDVLRNDMNIQKNFMINTLSYEETERLFWEIVGDPVEKLDLSSIAVEIIQKCAGLPIAIATIANALKHKSLSHWKNALDLLRKYNLRNFGRRDANVHSVIELSYNFLESEEAKSLLLLCSLHNVGWNVSIEDLLYYSMGLGLLQDINTLEEGRNRLLTLIDNLKASCLLLDSNSKISVRMHEVIHAVAVSVASKDERMFNIQDVTELKEKLEEKLPKDTIAISLPYKDIFVLPERLEYPKLKLLLLHMKNCSSQISDAFFQGVKELNVLNLTSLRLLSLPSSLRWLTNLQTLCLDRCRFEDIAIIGELKKLKILTFRFSKIEKLPREIGQLTRLISLNLRSCSKLRVIAPNVLSSLTRLEELRLGNSFIGWEVEGRSNASLAELKQLSRLTTLGIHILDAQIIPHDLLFGKLEDYRIFIGDVWDWSGKFETLRTLKLKLNNSIYLRNGIKILLNRSEELYLDELKGIENVVYELNKEGFPQLKYLHVQNALETRYIINSIGWGLCNVFPKLESLNLLNLISLEKICYGKLAMVSFSQLRIMKIRKCDRLKHLLTFSMAKNLLQLREIEVTDCKKLEEIVFQESEELQFNQTERISTIEFTQLRTLRLKCLPLLTSFGFNLVTPDAGSQEIVAAPDAGSLEIVAEDEPVGGFMLPFSQNVLLPRLEMLELSSVNIECMWLDQLPIICSCCRTLTSLTLKERSGNLKYLFSYSVIQSLVELQKLEIHNCKSIEEIINTEELRGEETISMMVFPKLINLQLKGLPKLTRFGYSGNSVEIPSLTQLFIKDCPNLKTFFSTSTSEDTHPLFGEKVVLPTLKSLNVSSIGIQTIWHNQFEVICSCFQNLTKLTVDGCDTLKYVFSSSMVESLIQLEVLEISNCKFMERVIITEGAERTCITQFSKLQELHLIHLPELTSFCNIVGNLIELPSLAHLWIANCPKMHKFVSNSPCVDIPTSKDEQMNSEVNLPSSMQPLFDDKVGLPNLRNLGIEKMDNLIKIWHDQLIPNSFCKLSMFMVDTCNEVVSLFPSNMLGRLQELEKLAIVNCDSIEEIFELQAFNCGKSQAITANQLEGFLLVDLPNLKHVWNMDSQVLLSFQNLLSIGVTGCHSLKSIFPTSIARGLLQLKELSINDCSMVEEIVAKEEEQVEAVPRFVFPQLSSLKLTQLSTLKSFYPDSYISEWPLLSYLGLWECGKLLASELLCLQENSGESRNEITNIQQPMFFVDKVAFPNLEILTLEWNCIVKVMSSGNFSNYLCKIKSLGLISTNEETTVCPCCFLYTLPNLEELYVFNGFLDKIFICEGYGCKEQHVEAPSKLRHLSLNSLEDLSHMWEENTLPCKVFQNVTTLQVVELGNLKTLVPSFVSFQNLTSLEVLTCNTLLNLVAVSTAKSMVHLTSMKIVECEMIQNIISHDRNEVEDHIIFKKLNYLELHSLRSITAFYSGNSIIEFPSLLKVVVIQCPNMKIFSQGVLSTPKLNKLQITEADDEGSWEGSLNMTIQKLFEDMSL